MAACTFPFHYEKALMIDTDPISLNLPHGWQTHWHHLTALPPDNDYPPDEVFFHFDEDLTYLTYQDYFIDAGFYGGYLSDRKGNFGLVVARGDFLGGSVLENFCTRDPQEVARRIVFYAQAIADGTIGGQDGIPFTAEDGMPDYSVYDQRRVQAACSRPKDTP